MGIFCLDMDEGVRVRVRVLRGCFPWRRGEGHRRRGGEREERGVKVLGGGEGGERRLRGWLWWWEDGVCKRVC